jgi:hypothetical protein
MTAFTRDRVAVLTAQEALFMTRDTVAVDTPATLATSSILALIAL